MPMISMDFKITPPKVKPQRAISLALAIIRPLLCTLCSLVAPVIVYLVEGCTTLFWWMLGFVPIIFLLLLVFDSQKIKDITEYLKIKYCVGIHRKKLLHVPSSYKNLSPLNLISAPKNSSSSLQSQILDGFEDSQSTTSSIVVDIPSSHDYKSTSSSSSASDEAIIPQHPTHLTPTRRRVISPASISLSPLRNKVNAPKISPVSKRRLGVSEYGSPRLLAVEEPSHLPSILESTYCECNADNLLAQKFSCFHM
ncbi:uncharacterized protein LOC129976311 [Argiope bruennichi]|uniref:Uncharacterized protein n=1 Tax=Argiope bruennichi TaxID=94029 RepID=A0A8T0ES31_ARGBR|nr:uncharacterized protein LOC129976311 [Argiope bruennichi]KAF8778650.1 hypothetical protein HNY73_015353 [Argiope bruennichi]